MEASFNDGDLPERKLLAHDISISYGLLSCRQLLYPRRRSFVLSIRYLLPLQLLLSLSALSNTTVIDARLSAPLVGQRSSVFLTCVQADVYMSVSGPILQEICLCAAPGFPVPVGV